MQFSSVIVASALASAALAADVVSQIGDGQIQATASASTTAAAAATTTAVTDTLTTTYCPETASAAAAANSTVATFEGAAAKADAFVGAGLLGAAVVALF
ncbi:hypothetical protein HII13_003609 [Brettanomyces bruxellensis]|uniref:Uncharacterized protein n=1 Tax=Dekkera bruxellensis TaxID=5007 RepID=A0A8H6EZ32_DEKBR|nr:uncharacterized protein BRETT_003790 [Brettanomyces bruxellensis]KAF6009264.1 hypothetical protein HII13_003609 [Brettanomyces bruxellensis]KAF6015728.1 hypothetical protein HII12_000890 [Brettanomyces bruxellensis]QOU19639.1 hypothetical protein BRETT_003790 [Brettanomyces bruxellensis]